MTADRRHIAALMVGLVLVSSPAWGDAVPTVSDQVMAPPPTYKAGGVTVDEHVGAKVPLDAAFQTADGKRVTLGEVLAGDLPTILTFNYSDCPMLCSLQLNGLTAALPGIAVPAPAPGADLTTTPIAFRVGAQFRIVTIDLESNESPAKLAKLRDRYIARLPEADRARARDGWVFLAAATQGDAAPLRRVADTVGFKYTYMADRAEWAHPAALVFLAANGTVTRYVYGIEFATDLMRESIFKAGLAEPSTAAGFMMRCYHFDPDANNHTRGGVLALRVDAAGFVALFLAGLGGLHFVRRRSIRRRSQLRTLTTELTTDEDAIARPEITRS